jgi:ABC-type Na+ efflux pump permease subunit
MPWNRNDPDPLEARRRQLAEQERLLSEQRRRLTEELYQSGESPAANVKPAEPPVWRMEEDGLPQRVAESTPARRRNLARQRQRDRFLFFVFIVLLLIVLVIVLWVAYVHNTAPVNGA